MKRVAAILVCHAETGGLRIAGLSVLDRLVVTTHRAGCAPIIIVSEAAPVLVRAGEMGIHASVVRAIPDLKEATLLITEPVVTEPADLQRVIESGGQLAGADGMPFPVKMTGSAPYPVVARGIAAVIRDAASARDAERRLWASLTSSADGIADRFLNRPLGRILSKVLVHTPISPNQVSLVSILIGVASAWYFAAGHFVLGALLLQFSAVVDCVDGDLARVLFKQSRLGKWLDLAGDQVVHCSVFGAIGLGVARTDAATPAIALGASAALGVLISFAVIVRAMTQLGERRNPRLEKLIDATTNRDFSILLLALALAGKMEFFLWLAGVGVHLFWMTALALQFTPGAGNAPAVSEESA